MAEIKIDTEKCIGCGACVNSCPAQMFKVEDDKSKLIKKEIECVLCKACETSCPAGAITVNDK